MLFEIFSHVLFLFIAFDEDTCYLQPNVTFDLGLYPSSHICQDALQESDTVFATCSDQTVIRLRNAS